MKHMLAVGCLDSIRVRSDGHGVMNTVQTITYHHIQRASQIAQIVLATPLEQ